MRDIRVDRWADVLVHYSLQAKRGQYAIITGDLGAMPLMEACYEKMIEAGVHVDVMLSPYDWKEILLAKGDSDQLTFTSPALLHAVERCDIYLGIGSESNAKLLANADTSKQALHSKARQPILNSLLGRAAEKKARWAYTHFPTPAAAQEADMGTREYEEFIFSLGHLNCENPIEKWREIEIKQQKLVDYLNGKKMLHFKNDQGTDLHVNVDGMKWVNCCGKINFPDGEVYTGPNLKAKDGGVNGVARYSLPTLYRSVEVRDIELTFEKGEVVKSNASKGEKFLHEMIKQDEGARFVGEIAIGTNPNMNRITKNILFDEKFGGTFHLALGKGYPQTGNTNQSALHWDMIFDLRNNGKVFADGELIVENGQFVSKLR